MKTENQEETKNSQRLQKYSRRESFLTVVVIVMVLGSLTLAVLDEASRPAFIELTKIAVAGYLGWMVPK